MLGSAEGGGAPANGSNGTQGGEGRVKEMEGAAVRGNERDGGMVRVNGGGGVAARVDEAARGGETSQGRAGEAGEGGQGGGGGDEWLQGQNGSKGEEVKAGEGADDWSGGPSRGGSLGIGAIGMCQAAGGRAQSAAGNFAQGRQLSTAAGSGLGQDGLEDECVICFVGEKSHVVRAIPTL